MSSKKVKSLFVEKGVKPTLSWTQKAVKRDPQWTPRLNSDSWIPIVLRNSSGHNYLKNRETSLFI